MSGVLMTPLDAGLPQIPDAPNSNAVVAPPPPPSSLPPPPVAPASIFTDASFSVPPMPPTPALQAPTQEELSAEERLQIFMTLGRKIFSHVINETIDAECVGLIDKFLSNVKMFSVRCLLLRVPAPPHARECTLTSVHRTTVTECAWCVCIDNECRGARHAGWLP